MVTIFLLPWQRSKGVSWMNNWHISLHLSISLVTGKPDPQNRLKFYTDGGSYYQIITKKKLFTERGSYNQINKKGVYDIGFILNGGSPIQIIKIWHIQFQLVTISSFDVHSFSQSEITSREVISEKECKSHDEILTNCESWNWKCHILILRPFLSCKPGPVRPYGRWT